MDNTVSDPKKGNKKEGIYCFEKCVNKTKIVPKTKKKSNNRLKTFSFPISTSSLDDNVPYTHK